MAQQREKESYGSHSSDAASLSLIDSVKQLAEAGLEKEYLTYDELLFKLRRWWCQYYKRPYKDPLLDSYTFEELLYEYYDLTTDRTTKESVASAELPQEEWDWAAEEEAKELAEAAAKASASAYAEPQSDTIEDEGLSDDKWADQYEQKVLENPTADQVDEEGGDVSASFEDT